MNICCYDWRYDPIFINKDFDVEKHLKCFENTAKQLRGYTHNCTICYENYRCKTVKLDCWSKRAD